MKPFDAFMLFTNNYCNLHCENCLCNTQEKRWEISLDHVRLFCVRFKGIGESKPLLLMGGETTALPAEKLEYIIDTLESFNRKHLVLLTNGFNLLGMNEKCLSKLARIKLNDHGINSQHIDNCEKYLKGFFKGHIKVVNSYYHYDLEVLRNHPQNMGRQCSQFMFITIHGFTIYLCPTLIYVEYLNNNSRMRDELIKANWTLHNPDIIETLKNWETTLPPYILDQCMNHCWKCDDGYRDKTLRTRITLKPNDVIKKT